MAIDLAAFQLTLQQLEDIRDDFVGRFRAGLASEGEQIKCLPAYLPRPTTTPTGEACVLDLGGTNLRVGGVRLDHGSAELLGEEVTDSALMRLAKTPKGLTEAEFFQRQATAAASALEKRVLPVGYCFSFPARVQEDGTAELVQWTKNVQLAGLVNENVARRLKVAIGERVGQDVPSIFTVNDTVAALMAAVVLRPGFDRYVGLIAGTGTNTATFVPGESLSKLKRPWNKPEMAINLESGGYHPPHLTPLDDEVATSFGDGNVQRFEKAMAGSYLPYLFARLTESTMNPADADAGWQLVKMRHRGDRVGRVARALVDRSADLVAAKIAGLVAAHPEGGRMAILGEGSFIAKTGGYVERVRSRLDALLPEPAEVELFTYEPGDDKPSANFIGSACAALVYNE